MAVFDECSAAHSGDLELTLRCVSNWIESENKRLQEMQQAAVNTPLVNADEFTTWMLLLTGALVFVMQAGALLIHIGYLHTSIPFLSKIDIHASRLRKVLQCSALVLSEKRT
jgi:hypothetical protein